MQLLNSNIPRRARTTRYSNKKAQDLLNLVLFVFCSFFVLQRWLPRQEGRRQAPLVTFVTANSCLLREDDYSFSLLLLSRLNKQKNTYGRQDSIRRRNTKKGQYNFCTVFFRGSPGKIRTCDTSVNSRVLLPLSY